MIFMKKYRPKFLEHKFDPSSQDSSLVNFRQLWKSSMAIILAVALIPLLVLAIIEYRVSKQAMESEILLRTSRLVSNARRTLTSYLEERKFALRFVVLDNSYEQLHDASRLEKLLERLKTGLGEWSELGVVDADGIQKSYAGPYKLKGADYSKQDWYTNIRQSVEKMSVDDTEMYSSISDVFLGFRNSPHLVISVLHSVSIGGQSKPYILRASLELDHLTEMLSQLEVSGNGDAFLINREGVLQTPSRYYGKILDKMPFPVPEFAERTEVVERTDPYGNPVVIGYAYITGSPFICMVVKQKTLLMQSWYESNVKVMIFLGFSILLTGMVVFSIATYLVNTIYLADLKQQSILHKVEYANKMASIGRLSAGVAHEINNPLAIINEKAGLIKDLFTFRKEYAGDTRLLNLVTSIINAVDRCSTITRQLLSFARNISVSVQKVSLRQVVNDVLEFQLKEAEHRRIKIDLDIPETLPDFVSDRGKLQQIFINLVNNAFTAMKDGGKLSIKSRLDEEHKNILIEVADTGHGIHKENIQRIFEPFFTTNVGGGGTGLGLSITYGLLKEIGGSVGIESTVGVGTTFTITLPLEYQAKKGDIDASVTG